MNEVMSKNLYLVIMGTGTTNKSCVIVKTSTQEELDEYMSHMVNQHYKEIGQTSGDVLDKLKSLLNHSTPLKDITLKERTILSEVGFDIHADFSNDFYRVQLKLV